MSWALFIQFAILLLIVIFGIAYWITCWNDKDRRHR